MKPDFQEYRKIMEEIKKRIEVITALLNGKINLPYKTVQVETLLLQVRMVLELVALSTLAANREVFEANQKKFRNSWRVSNIIKDVEKLNNDFYPIPLQHIQKDGVDLLDEVTSGRMELSDLIKIHGQCGERLHAQNPYDKEFPIEYFEKNIPDWMNKVMRLLALHKIKLLNDDIFYLVYMEDPKTKNVEMYAYGKKSP
ncbi:hypothetical protein [Photobacterium arenosum]|uniref:hypothetical protein n=1 Tax=Photobacterium arenosum TaxID=2774143 RepID=UPI0028894D71|nr:hypothetical protein [Photobacterium arenosum]